jgi:hypothetical protein
MSVYGSAPYSLIFLNLKTKKLNKIIKRRQNMSDQTKKDEIVKDEETQSVETSVAQAGDGIRETSEDVAKTTAKGAASSTEDAGASISADVKSGLDAFDAGRKSIESQIVSSRTAAGIKAVNRIQNLQNGEDAETGESMLAPVAKPQGLPPSRSTFNPQLGLPAVKAPVDPYQVFEDKDIAADTAYKIRRKDKIAELKRRLQLARDISPITEKQLQEELDKYEGRETKADEEEKENAVVAAVNGLGGQMEKGLNGVESSVKDVGKKVEKSADDTKAAVEKSADATKSAVVESGKADLKFVSILGGFIFAGTIIVSLGMVCVGIFSG